jgi:hypothetical protein
LRTWHDYSGQISELSVLMAFFAERLNIGGINAARLHRSDTPSAHECLVGLLIAGPATVPLLDLESTGLCVDTARRSD